MNRPRLRELVLLAAVAGTFAIGAPQVDGYASVALLGFVVIFAVMHLAVRILAPQSDPILLPVAGFLVMIGALQLAAIDRVQVSAVDGWRPLGPLQTGWLAVSALGMIATLWIFRRGLGKAWEVRYTLALLGVAAILAPLLPGLGHTVNGARLWLRIGPLSFQPGEAAKILLVLFLASYLAERRELLTLPTRRIGPLKLPDPRYLAPLLGIIGVSMLVFVQQNDLGSPLLFFLTFMSILWVATGKAFYPLVGVGLFAGSVYVALKAFPHVAVRFTAWLDPFSDPEHSGFQILQGQYALAEGGLTGVGLASPETQPHFIPFAWTDFIFASLGHTLGLAGLVAVLMAFVILLTRIFFIGLRSRSDLHALGVAGFGIVVGLQAGIIAAGVTRVLPLTGVTLPFVSYGGSSLLANFVILGCLLAVSNNEETTHRLERDREEVPV